MGKAFSSCDLCHQQVLIVPMFQGNQTPGAKYFAGPGAKWL